MAKETPRERQGRVAEDKRIAREEIQTLKEKSELLNKEAKQTKDIASNLQSYLASRKESAKLQEKINSQQKLEEKLLESAQLNQSKSKRHIGDIYNLESLKVKKNIEELHILKKQVESQSLSRAVLGSTLGLIEELSSVNLRQELSYKNILRYLVEQQKSLKQLNLQLGISGEKSKILQESISNTSFQTQILGKGLKDITEMITAYADESGRARLMTEQSQKSIAEIAAGTALGNVEASKLVAKFSEMGVNAIGTNKEITGVLDTSEKMALNADNILKSISANFSALSKFHFKRGVKELSELVIFSTKFKMDIGDTLNAMEKGRYLDSVIEMSAQLRLAGGAASAVADPFKLLFASRNSPKQFALMVKDMTKDISQLNKEGEFEILATGFDRLKIISEATSIPIEKLAETARRTAQIDIMAKSIPSFARANKEYKELIEGQAQWNKDLRIFEIVDPFNPKRFMDIKKISEIELKAFKAAGSSLSQRAKDSQDFQAVWINLTNQIKSAFLPLLTGLNKVTGWIQSATEGIKGLGSTFTMVLFGIGIPAFLGLGKGLLSIIPNLISMNLQMKLMGGTMTKFSAMSKGMPKGGIMSSIFGGLGGPALLKSSLYIAGAIALIGTSLIPFSYAMGLMSDVEWKKFDGVAKALGGLSLGLLALLPMAGLGIPLAIGLGAMALPLMGIANAMKNIKESNIGDIGFGFKMISSSVNAIDSDKLKEIKETAEALRGLSEKNNVFSQLKDMFKDSLKVEFKDKTVDLIINLTSEIDGDTISQKTVRKTVELYSEAIQQNILPGR